MKEKVEQESSRLGRHEISDQKPAIERGGRGGVAPRETAEVKLEFWPMPYLRDDGVLCTFSTRTSAITAGFARSSQLSSSRPGKAVRSVREGGMDRPSQHKSHPAGSLSSSQPGGPPCWVISLAFGLIGINCSKKIKEPGSSLWIHPCTLLLLLLPLLLLLLLLCYLTVSLMQWRRSCLSYSSAISFMPVT